MITHKVGFCSRLHANMPVDFSCVCLTHGADVLSLGAKAVLDKRLFHVMLKGAEGNDPVLFIEP